MPGGGDGAQLGRAEQVGFGQHQGVGAVRGGRRVGAEFDLDALVFEQRDHGVGAVGVVGARVDRRVAVAAVEDGDADGGDQQDA